MSIGQALPHTLSPIPLSEVRLEAPIPSSRRNIFCVEKSYNEHAKEFSASGVDSSAMGGATPRRPIIFSKTIIVTISAGVTGVGIGFKPLKYLVSGDVARIEISEIGLLENEFHEARA